MPKNGTTGFQAGIDLPHPLPELCGYLEGVVPFLDLKARAQDLLHGQVGSALCVREATALEPGDPLALERAPKLVEQARLADPRFAHDGDHLAAAFLGAREAVVEQAELALATRQPREAPLRGELHPRPCPLTTNHPVGGDRLAAPLHLQEADWVAPHVSFDEPVGGSGEDDRARFGLRLHARRQIGGVSDGRVVHAQVVADPADHHRPRVEAHSQAELQSLLAPQLFAESTDGLPDGQSGLHGPQRVFLDGYRRPEERHQPIAQELVDRSLVTMDGLGHERQRLIHELVHRLRTQALGQIR